MLIAARHASRASAHAQMTHPKMPSTADVALTSGGGCWFHSISFDDYDDDDKFNKYSTRVECFELGVCFACACIYVCFAQIPNRVTIPHNHFANDDESLLNFARYCPYVIVNKYKHN